MIAGARVNKTLKIAQTQGTLRYSRWDALLVFLSAMHAAILIALPLMPVIALGLWWNANTISHNFIHKPFFRQQALNRLFSFYLSVLLGFPQSMWRDRHIAHHAGVVWQKRINRQILIEAILIAVLWIALLTLYPVFFLTVYLPGYFAGIGLCYLQGYYEHARGTTSNYGVIYNTLLLNDGYHVEHHADPSAHWTQLPKQFDKDARASRWPAVLRWIDAINLETLEKLVLRSRLLQRFMLKTHERAVRRLLQELGEIRRIGIVGGGIFPRTVLILQRLLPGAQLVVIDAKSESIQVAQTFIKRGNDEDIFSAAPSVLGGENVMSTQGLRPGLLSGRPLRGLCKESLFLNPYIDRETVEFIHEWYDPARHNSFDLVIIPLSFIGDRESIYRHPPAPAVLIHDWIWRRRGESSIVSLFLFKRLNLVKR